MQSESPLRGMTLVVTRPRAQAPRTAAALREAGAQVLECPVLEIAPLDITPSPDELADASAVIFVSANAVAHGVPVIRRAGEIAASAQILAIGRATAAALADAGFKNVVSPQQSIDSEGLLAMPQLRDVKGRHIILVKGHSEPGGRQLLQQALAARGARVTVLECYQRTPLMPDPAVREALRSSLASGCMHGCFALSIETLDSLTDMFSTMEISPQSQIVLLVPHLRVADAARSHGFANIAEVPMAELPLIAALTELRPLLLSPSHTSPAH